MYVLLGSNGNITSKVARILLSQQQRVRVIGRSAQSLVALKEAGAEVAIGDLENTAFLTDALRGATAIYAMIPPNYASTAFLAYQDRVGESIVAAITASGVKRVVNLSSTGAHLPKGTGPIAGLYAQEQRLNRLAGVEVLHLRPGYFFENHFNALGTIQAMGVYADMIDSHALIPMVGTGDIAVVVARELVNPSGQGKRVLHLRAPKRYSQADAAAVLGAAIGKPGLQHVQADPAQAKAGMMQFGLSQNVADLFEEMSAVFSSGTLNATVEAGPTEITPTTLENFAATVFAPAFRAAA
ncbi:MAG: NAD(P)H-binding protein [Betaproteobacteria bacterium]|nr:NAD(P)H-binding protein [Betaproteobacteria bacterium]